MTIHLYLIRHGESEANLSPHIIGGRSPESPLTLKGKWQAGRLREYFGYEQIYFNPICSSPLLRCMQTMEIVRELQRSEIACSTDTRLVEFSQGDWEGKLRADVYTPDVLLKMARLNYDFQPPFGESQRMVENRVAEWLEEDIVSKYRYCSNVNVGVFSHGITIKCLMHHIMGFNSDLIWKIDIDNTSVSKFTFDDLGWHVNYINNTAHLE